MKETNLALDVINMRNILSHLYQKMFHELSKTYEITQMEIDILLFLANNPEYDSAVDLVKRRHLTKSHVSKSIDELVKKGYLQRFFKEDNRKVIHLQLTPACTSIIEEGRKVQLCYANIISQNITKEEAKTAEKVLFTLLENARRELDEGKKE